MGRHSSGSGGGGIVILVAIIVALAILAYLGFLSAFVKVLTGDFA